MYNDLTTKAGIANDIAETIDGIAEIRSEAAPETDFDTSRKENKEETKSLIDE
jgi:hypothetical protein